MREAQRHEHAGRLDDAAAAYERLLARWPDRPESWYNAVKTASVWQVREPLYTRSSGRWRNYARHVEPLRAALGEPPT